MENRTEIENKKGSFIETDFIRKVKQKLTTINYMLMWGKPGCGKTASLRYISKYLQDDFGYKVVPCYKPSDIFKNEEKNEKQLFIVDDICGKYVFSFEIFLRWKRRTKHIERLIQADKSKLIMTCSSSVFMSDIVKTLNIFTDNAIEITMHAMSLHDLNEDFIKDSTLSVIIEHKLFDQLPLPMIKLGRYLPMREALEYFDNSSRYVQRKVDELRESNFSAFCSLFLIILKQGCIAEIVMTSDDHLMFTTISRNVFKELNVDISRRRFMDNLLFLMDIFVTKENGSYTIKQTDIFEALAVYFGETLQELFIRNADPEIITQHCSLEKCPTVLDERFHIHVKEKNEALYFQRIRKQLLRGNVSEVLAVPQIKLSSYQKKLAEFLRNLGTDVVKQISRSKCKIERETTFTLIRRYVYVDLLKLFFDCDPTLSLEDYPYLEIACKTNNIDLARFLVSKEMDMNKYTSDGCTPLHIACKNGFFSLVFLLVSKGADVNCSEKHGNTPLIQVCEKENEKVISFLLDNDADINKSNSNGQVPLMISASKNRNKIVELLIKRNADVNIVDCSGLTCLMYAIKSEFENRETVMTLLKSGVDVNIQSEDGKTAIIVAIQMQRKDVITILTDYITDATFIRKSELYRDNAKMNYLNQGDNRGITPLIYACELRNQNFDVVKYLISKGATVNCSDYSDRTPLVVALLNDDDKLVEYLLNHDANVNLPGNKRTTPLHEMCKIGQCDNVVLLISKKCDVDVVDRKSMTPLMIASACGFSEITKVLIQANAKINIADHKGTTALMLACMGGFIDVIRDLVENKADVNKTDTKNWTALLAYANSQYDNAEIVDFLISQGANVNSVTNDEVSSLMMASFHGHEQNVKSMIQHKADVNHKDSYGKTPLSSACLSGNVDIVRFLIENGADVEVVDKNGDTLESLARKNKLTKMVDFFCKK